MLCSDVLLFAFLVLLDFLDGLGTNGPLSCSSIVAFNQVSWSSWYYLHKFCWTFKSEFMFREKVTSNFLFLSIMTVKLMFYMHIHLWPICGKLWIWLNDLNVGWEVRFDCYNYFVFINCREKQLESHSNCIRHDRENQGLDKGNMAKIDGYQNLFGLMKQRFLSFKKKKIYVRVWLYIFSALQKFISSC